MENDCGWFIHLVTGDGFAPGTCNAHTHGMGKYGHQDFQFVIELPEEHIGNILGGLCDRVKDGERFKAGDMVSDVFTDCDARLDEFEEDGRIVLRVVVPDTNYLLPEYPECEWPYSMQSLKTAELMGVYELDIG